MEGASVASSRLPRTRRRTDRFGDVALYGLTALAAGVGLLIVAAVVWRVADGAWPAMRHFGIGFLWHNEWNPVTSRFGAVLAGEAALEPSPGPEVRDPQAVTMATSSRAEAVRARF